VNNHRVGWNPGGPTGDLVALGYLLDPVRRSVYEYVAGVDRPVAREDAAMAIGISRELAAFHLEKLVAAGLIEAAASPASRTSKRGRPPKLYRRARAELEASVPARRYHLLARIFAEAVASRWPTLRRAAVASARELGRELATLERRPARRNRSQLLASRESSTVSVTSRVSKRRAFGSGTAPSVRWPSVRRNRCAN
jgi:predicted ArsR family transcriptional regulator